MIKEDMVIYINMLLKNSSVGCSMFCWSHAVNDSMFNSV